MENRASINKRPNIAAHITELENSKSTPVYLARLPNGNGGRYYPLIKAALIKPKYSQEKVNSTILHELAHSSEDVIFPIQPGYQQTIDFVKDPNNNFVLDLFHPETLTPSETRSLNWQVVDKVLQKYLQKHPEIKDLRTDPKVVQGFNDYVDNMSNEEVAELYENLNRYGDDYASLIDLRWAKIPHEMRSLKDLKDLNNVGDLVYKLDRGDIKSTPLTDEILDKEFYTNDKLWHHMKSMIKYGLAGTGVINKKADTD